MREAIKTRRAGYRYNVEYDTLVEAPIEAVFAFLMDPRNLAKFDPPKLDIRMMSTHGEGCGLEAEYVIRWFGIPVYLRAKVIECIHPKRCLLEQFEGPWMKYTHLFELREEQGGTVISQRGDFVAEQGWANSMLHRWVIRRQISGVHAYRRASLKRLLTSVQVAGNVSK